MNSKRGRVDGHLSKEEYDQYESFDNAGKFSRATPNTIANRRKVTANVVNKRKELVNHIKTLNKNFSDWFRNEYRKDPNVCMIDGVQDYIDYMKQLEDKYLRSYGEVLTFGSGDCGQLAHGIESDDDLMVKYPRIVYSLRYSDKKVVGIACGGLHNAVFTEEGLVYTWGCSDDGSLGRIGDESMPGLVEGCLVGQNIVGVACGDGQTMAVTSNGDLYGWGCYKDKEGQKWFDAPENAPDASKTIKRQQNEPMKIAGLGSAAGPGLEVVEIACGSVFNLARTASGQVYSWGLGECGELGRKVAPMKVEGSYDMKEILRGHLTVGLVLVDIGRSSPVPANYAKSIGCGAYHSLVVLGGSFGGVLFTCGLNNYGQLGTGDTLSKTHLVGVRGLDGKSIASAKGGIHHSLVLTSDGELYAFGRGDSGQLGLSTMSNGAAGDFLTTPELVKCPIAVGMIACGANHNLVLSDDRTEVYTWGYGDMLALGHGKDKDEATPKRLVFQGNFSGGVVNSILQVCGGGQHSAVIAEVKTTRV